MLKNLTILRTVCEGTHCNPETNRQLDLKIYKHFLRCPAGFVDWRESQVFTAVTTKNVFFWDVAACRFCAKVHTRSTRLLESQKLSVRFVVLSWESGKCSGVQEIPFFSVVFTRARHWILFWILVSRNQYIPFYPFSFRSVEVHSSLIFRVASRN
jgi:hypothetical protein